MPLDFVIDTLSHFVRRVDGPPPGIPAHVRPDFEQELTWLCEWHALTPIILDSLDRLALHPQISRIAFERIRALSSAERALSADLVATACSLSERFAARNVGCLLMDGVLLAPTLYAKRGLRPIQKIDLLIREGDWVVALECCREAGFELLPRSPRFDDGADALLYYQHYPACTLQNKAGDQLRLHMRILDIGSPEEVGYRSRIN
jgi:hypothetical protein